MRKLYHLYNENFEITHAQFFIDGEQPENAIFLESCNFTKPMLNPETFEVYEGATPEEIAEQENQQKQELKRQAHEELLKTDWYVVRFVERGIEIPKEILEQRELIRNSI